jgi:hypothetical protein
MLEKVLFKLMMVRKFLKGWGYNGAGACKKRKKDILEGLFVLEQMEEVRPLDEEHVRRRCSMLAELYKMMEEEELYRFKRCHETWPFRGTIIFHRLANSRKRKHTIFSLEDGVNHIIGNGNLIKHAT